jgi:hypothetical protein
VNLGVVTEAEIQALRPTVEAYVAQTHPQWELAGWKESRLESRIYHPQRSHFDFFSSPVSTRKERQPAYLTLAPRPSAALNERILANRFSHKLAQLESMAAADLPYFARRDLEMLRPAADGSLADKEAALRRVRTSHRWRGLLGTATVIGTVTSTAATGLGALAGADSLAFFLTLPVTALGWGAIKLLDYLDFGKQR